MTKSFDSLYSARSLYREIVLLKELTSFSNNIFTTKIYDVIIPPNVIVSKHTNHANYNLPEIVKKENENNRDKDLVVIETDGFDCIVDLNAFEFVFIVMELHDTDLKDLFTNTPKNQLTDDHIITILYNILLSVNYLHSANIIHRDIKPSNFLIDSECHIHVCDFGLARVAPEQSKIHQIINLS